MFVAFPLHTFLFHPLLQYKHYETHPVSHQGPLLPCENKAYEEDVSDGGHCGLSGHTSKEQAGTFCHHCFLLKHFCSNCLTAYRWWAQSYFQKGLVSIVTSLWKHCHFPWQSASAVLLECIDQTTQRSNPFFPLLAQRPNPLSQKGFLPPGWGRLIPQWNWELLSAGWSQQAGEGVKLVLSRAAQSGLQAHFFHHLFIHRPCHCCHQSAPEDSGHAASEKANQPKVLQKEINSNSSHAA